MKLTRHQMWWVLGVEALFLGLLAVWLWSRLDRLFEPNALLVALAIVAAGNLIGALVMQYFSRSHITVSPGESAATSGRVLSGFRGTRKGRVTVRGERWHAETEASQQLSPGDRVTVLSRSGLTLTVKPLDPHLPPAPKRDG